MDEYNNTLSEATGLGLDISSCEEGDINCLKALIYNYNSARKEASELNLNIDSCKPGDIECLKGLIDDYYNFGR